MGNCIQTAITGINTTEYFSCPIPIPPIPEQHQIAGILSLCDETIAATHISIKATKTLKMKMINEMFNPGK